MPPISSRQIQREILDKLRVKLVEEFSRNFARKAFFGQAWAPRKYGRRGSLLVVSGRLRRSLRGRVKDGGVLIDSSMPYASAHNEGVKGTITVPSYTVREHRARRRTGPRGRRWSKVPVRAHSVRAHARMVNLPERRFVGDAPEVRRIIAQIISRELEQLSRQLTETLRPNK